MRCAAKIPPPTPIAPVSMGCPSYDGFDMALCPDSIFWMRCAVKRVRLFATTVVSLLATSGALAGSTTSPPGAKVYIIWPSDGQVIPGGEFWLRMGARGIGVCPAGVKMANVGHHHVIIDALLPPPNQEIPNDPTHRHFGRGQTEARLQLRPGRHTIQLLMADQDHIPHDPPLYSKVITVIVP